MKAQLHAAGPGRVRDAERLVALHDEIVAGDRTGTTVFIGGDEEHGRTALMRSVAAQLRGRRSSVMAGRLERDGFEPWGPDGETRKLAIELLESVLPMAQTLHPVIGLLSMALAPGNAAVRLLT